MSDRTAENLCRAVAGELGGSVMSAMYPMTGAQVKQAAVHGSLSLALGIGRCIRIAREGASDIFVELIRYLESQDGRRAAVVFDGKISDVSHEIRNGWHWGTATLIGLNDEQRRCTIKIRNEFLIACVDDKPVAMVPDLITLLDRESGEPLTASMLSYGQRVKVIAYAADPLLRRPEALAVLGPRPFGIDEDFVPLERLLASP